MGLEIVYGIGVVVLAVGLIYGILQYKARNRKNDAITEEATREQYAHPETYDERREELKKKLHPS